MAILMKSDGSRLDVTRKRQPEQKTFWSLDELLETMGGRWQCLRHISLGQTDHFVLCQTKSDGRYNEAASTMLGQYVSGDILLLVNGIEMK